MKIVHCKQSPFGIEEYVTALLREWDRPHTTQVADDIYEATIDFINWIKSPDESWPPAWLEWK
jgi:hypothetical protein